MRGDSSFLATGRGFLPVVWYANGWMNVSSFDRVSSFTRFNCYNKRIASDRVYFFRIYRVFLCFFFVRATLISGARCSSKRIFGRDVKDVGVTVKVRFTSEVNYYGTSRDANFRGKNVQFMGVNFWEVHVYTFTTLFLFTNRCGILFFLDSFYRGIRAVGKSFYQ